MSELPTISVVIPCFNSEAFVETAVRSALDQTYPVEEVICVDDGSTDGTLNLLRDVRSSGGDIIIHAQENKGISTARNVGLEMASSEYVAFLDHDDSLHPKKLEHQAQLIAESDFRPDFVAAAYRSVWPEEGSKTKTRGVSTNSDPWIGLIHARIGRTSSNLWRAPAIQAVGAWQDADGLSLDTGLMFRMLKNKCRMVSDPIPLTTRHILGSSASNANREKQWRTFLDLRAEIFTYLQANALLTKERRLALHVDMFRAIRGLYEHDPEFAIRKHKELIQKNFSSLADGLGPGRLYRVLYAALGFRYAEALYPLWLNTRNAASTWFARQK